MALILKRATELQAAGEEPVHTLAAIQQIAQQVGIDPRLIAEAAASLGPAAEARVHFFGAPSTYHLSRRLGRPLPSCDHAAVLAMIRAHMPLVGEAKEFAGGVEWQSGPADNKTAITFTPTTDETIVRISGRALGPKVIHYLSAGVLTMLIGVLGTAVSPAVGAGLALAMLVASFSVARMLWDRTAARGRARAQGLLDALSELTGAPALPSSISESMP
ncbi:MAG: hypothetical protein WBC97_02280 [Gemmatimonadales bacterium]